jgi:hypothetical protein
MLDIILSGVPLSGRIPSTRSPNKNKQSLNLSWGRKLTIVQATLFCCYNFLNVGTLFLMLKTNLPLTSFFWPYCSFTVSVFCSCNKIPEQKNLKEEGFGSQFWNFCFPGRLAPLFLNCSEAEHHGGRYGRAKLLISWQP